MNQIPLCYKALLVEIAFNKLPLIKEENESKKIHDRDPKKINSDQNREEKLYGLHKSSKFYLHFKKLFNKIYGTHKLTLSKKIITSNMGQCSAKDMTPDELVVFRKSPTTTLLDNIYIPEIEENRKPTDRKFFIVFIVVIVLLVPFLIYTLINSDIDRIHGYDNCGNVCGKKNAKYDQWPCTGEDFTNEKYLQFDDKEGSKSWDLSRRHCVRECESGYEPIFGVCIKKSSDDSKEEQLFADISNYLLEVRWRIILCIAVAFGVTLIMLFLFRKATAAVVWGILGGALLFGGIVIAIGWFMAFSDDVSTSKNDNQSLISVCGLFSVLWLVMLFVVIFLRKKIELVIMLFTEATKAAFAMPLLVFTPVITFFVELILAVVLITLTVYMSTSGTLTELTSSFYEYEMNPVMIFTIVLNFWVIFWIVQFVIGIQYMVIAGAVSKWYFSKNKDNLNAPIIDSAKIVFKFHLGSIACGSLIITLVAILRAFIMSLLKNKWGRLCADILLNSIERFLKFLSKNAYIITAMHGKAFFKSGKRAAQIIFQNVVNITSLNYIGDFVLFMAQLLIVMITMLITTGIMQGTNEEYRWSAYLIVFILSIVIAVTFFAIFETTIDTIFICFCEDQLLNDGMARPYAMSRNLMMFVDNSKKIYGDKKN